jgi:hypothetical protein
MTRPRRGDLVLTVLLLAVFAGAYALSLAWPFRSALFPRLVSATGAVLTVALLVTLLVWGRRATGDTAPTAATPAATPGGPPTGDDEGDGYDVEYVFATAGARAWSAALAWIAGFFASLWLLGAVVTVPVFSLAYLRVAGGVSWRAAIAYAAVAGVVVAVVLGRLLSVPMPTGVL